jgi:hypothetical protein
MMMWTQACHMAWLASVKWARLSSQVHHDQEVVHLPCRSLLHSCALPLRRDCLLRSTDCLDVRTQACDAHSDYQFLIFM